MARLHVLAWLQGLFGTESNVVTTTGSRSYQPKRKRSEYLDGKGGSQEHWSSAVMPLRYRTRSRARQAANAALFASVVQPLVDNGFLEAQEVGKLAQVCKVVNGATKEDDIWAALCTRDYPYTYDFNLSFRERKGYRDLYKSWCAPVPKRPRIEQLPPLSPPPCKAKELYFFINIVYNGKSLFSRVFDGQTMKYLLVGSGCTVTLWDPVVLGKAKWTSIARGRMVGGSTVLPVGCDPMFDRTKLEMSVHMYRESDEANICIFRSKDRRSESCTLLAPPRVEAGGRLWYDAKFDFTKKQRFGSLCFRKLSKIEQLPLKETPEAHQVFHRLPYPVHFGAGLRFGVVGSGDYAVTALHFWALWMNPVSNCLQGYNSSEEAKKHGVTLLHILSHLSG